MSMLCTSCGRVISNAEGDNQAGWTAEPMQMPYCLDSDECQRDTEQIAGILGGPWLCRHGVDLAEDECRDCIQDRESRL